jgi:hypothetical protein
VPDAQAIAFLAPIAAPTRITWPKGVTFIEPERPAVGRISALDDVHD